jgi:hypothetical protein
MTTTHTKPEKFLSPKELVDALEALGFAGLGHRACMVLVRAMRDDKAPIFRHKYARPSDAAAWLLAHPTWRPHGKNRTTS